MRYLVLSFPRLPIQLARRADPALAARPFALTRGDGDAALLSAVSAEATADGVEAGMTSMQARQRCPGIELAGEAQGRELEALEAGVSIIRTYATPNVAILSRNEIAVAITGLAGRFADEGALALSITGLVRSRSGLDVRSAVASSVQEASCAARTARRFPVLCGESPAREQPLPAFEPFSAGFTLDTPGSEATVSRRLGQLAATLDAAAAPYNQSYREVVLEVEHGPYRTAFALRPEAPIHTAAEGLDLVRGRIPAGELAGTTAMRFTLSRPGPDLRIEPWRSPVATIHQLSGPAVPVQRRLLRAS